MFCPWERFERTRHDWVVEVAKAQLHKRHNKAFLFPKVFSGPISLQLAKSLRQWSVKGEQPEFLSSTTPERSQNDGLGRLAVERNALEARSVVYHWGAKGLTDTGCKLPTARQRFRAQLARTYPHNA